MKKKIRPISLFLLVLFSLALFAACGGKDLGDIQEDFEEVDTSERAGPALDKDTVVICTADETPSLTTAGHSAVAGDYINKITHNGLFRLDKELNPQPDLVESYVIEEDENGEETIWLFTIHEGIKFHDGTIMKADDILASIAHAKESSEVKSYTQSIHKIEKVDDLTVKIITDGPSASLLYDLAYHGNFILPAQLLERAKANPELLNKEPIGAGPYKFLNWKEGEQLEFEAHEAYFDKKRAPKIKNIVWKIIPEGNLRTAAIEAGEVDYIIETDSNSLTQLEANTNLNVMKTPTVSHNWLGLNNEVEPFDNILVRKAINAAINKEDVITLALRGTGIVAKSQTPTGMLGEYTDHYDGFDLDLAKSYMDQWGGDPATIEFDMICSNDTKLRAAEVIQENLSKIGIEASISSMDLAGYLSQTAEGNFTGFIGGYTSNEMMSFLKGVYLSDNIGSSNRTRTNQPELDALIEKATKTLDQEEREKVLAEATKFLNELCPQVPLYQDYNLATHKAGLKNTFVGAGGRFYVEEWTW